VQVESLVPLEPAFDVLVFVRGVVVQDQVHLESSGDLAVDGLEELQELLVPMPGQARAANNVVVPLRL